jgi:hypothetical protein
MIVFGPLLVIAGICFICWLLFTLAVGITSFLRFTGVATPGPAGQGMART